MIRNKEQQMKKFAIKIVGQEGFLKEILKAYNKGLLDLEIVCLIFDKDIRINKLLEALENFHAPIYIEAPGDADWLREKTNNLQILEGAEGEEKIQDILKNKDVDMVEL